MKKRTLAMLLITAVMISFVPFAAHASSNGDTMTSIIKYIKKGNISKIRKLNKKLPKYAEEKCVINMSSEMRQAFKNEVKKWENKKSGNDYLFRDYYLTDIDNDGVAELLIYDKTCYADADISVFTYNND